MAFVDDRARPEMAHHIILEEREQLSISGVEEVESFVDNSLLLTNAQGALVFQGVVLHIEKVLLDGGDLRVEGRVHALLYESEAGRRGGGFLSRLLGG